MENIRLRRSFLLLILLQVVSEGAPLFAGSENFLVVQKPLDRQVNQVRSNGRAPVLIQGKLQVAAARIEAACVRHDAQVPEPDWITLITDLPKGDFDARIELPSGGWFTLLFRAVDPNGQIMGETRVERVGVGEVFLVAGQSNSANHGSEKLSAEDDRVSSCHWGTAWKLAADPHPCATGNGGSPWPALGDLLAKDLNVPIGFYSVGFGGSEVKEWLPKTEDGKTHYPRIQNALRVLGPHGARALLWNQGEGDVFRGTSPETYRDRLQTIITASRKDAGFELPWFVAHASFLHRGYHGGVATEDRQKAVRQGQALVWESGMARQGVDTDDMRDDFRAPDAIHFSGKGLKEHARRWYVILKIYLEEARKAYPPPVASPAKIELKMLERVTIAK